MLLCFRTVIVHQIFSLQEFLKVSKILKECEICFSSKGVTRLIQGWRTSRHICDPTLEKNHTCVNILDVVKHLVMHQTVPSIKIVPTLMRYVSYVIICDDKNKLILRINCTFSYYKLYFWHLCIFCFQAVSGIVFFDKY